MVDKNMLTNTGKAYDKGWRETDGRRWAPLMLLPTPHLILRTFYDRQRWKEWETYGEVSRCPVNHSVDWGH